MCSIFLTNKPGFDMDAVNRFLRLRGPDHTETLTRDGLTFVHNLLSINRVLEMVQNEIDRATFA